MEHGRPKLVREILDMLGLWPLAGEDAAPTRSSRGTIERQGVVIESLHFQSKPGLTSPPIFYRPEENHGKLPAILYVCGHANAAATATRPLPGSRPVVRQQRLHTAWSSTRRSSARSRASITAPTASAGCVKGQPTPKRFWWHSAGYTPAGVECWNGVRAIDYLVTRPDVDADKIGVTGISGGGAATFWIAAADDRVKVAVPVSGMSDLEST